ncbi:MAG: GIY-YIG nuclease family protein [Candidatus Colwellbacteria bacterium]|nr:GIY-YIG nuclease family protein [Candidatus Colwellbacteria bacterium]
MDDVGVYILESLKKARHYYIGSTHRISDRLFQHNAGWVASTKNYAPLKVVAFISCESITHARRAEYRLKSYKRKDIIEKVINDKVFPWLKKRV